MNNKNHTSKKVRLIIVTLLLCMVFIIPFSSGVSDNANNHDKTPKKLKIDKDNKLFSSKHTYSNEFINVKTDKDNTLNIDTSIFNKNYISVGDYQKNKKDIDFEVSFYTGNNGITYSIYKSDLVFVPKKKVREDGDYLGDFVSVDGYVNVVVSGFSTIILSMPDLTIPFHNTASIDLRQYFDDDNVDHYAVAHYQPTGNFPPSKYELYQEGVALGNGDTFDLSLYRSSGNAFLDVYMYDVMCTNDVLLEECWFEGNDIGIAQSFNYISVFACESGESVTLTETTDLIVNDGCDVDYFYANTHPRDFYYRSSVYTGPDGLHEDMTEYYSFNEFFHEEEESEVSELNGRWDTQLTSTNFPTYTTINEFKAGGYEGGAFDFDGGNDYFNLNDMQLIQDTEFSINVWIKMSNTGASLRMFGEGYTGSNTPFQSLLSDGDTATWEWRSTTGYVSIQSTTSIVDNQWHMLTIVKDGTTGYLYVDGVAEGGTESFSGTWTVDSTYMGALKQSSTSGYFDGLIDEFAIFDTALTSDQIEYMYNGGNGVDFFNLNSPSKIIAPPLAQYDLSIGNNYWRLSNYFTYDQIETLTYSATYYDLDTTSFETVENGESFSSGDLFDISITDGDLLNIEYFGNPPETPTGYDGEFIATSVLGSTEKGYFITYTPDAPDFTEPPYQFASLNNEYTTDITLNLSDYFGNYTEVNIQYYDEITNHTATGFINLTNYVFTGGTVSNIGNLSVVLSSDGGSVSLIFEEVDGYIYDGEFTFFVINSQGSLNWTMNVATVPPIDLQFASIGNQNVAVGEDLVLNFFNYFVNITTARIDYILLNGSSDFMTNALPCDNVSCPVANSTDYGDYIIGMDGELQMLFANINSSNTTIPFTVSVTDGMGGVGYASFNITMSESPLETGAEEYFNNWLSGLYNAFPDSDDLNKFQKLLYFLAFIVVFSVIILLGLRNKNPTLIKWIMGIMVLLVFFLFAKINYISVGAIILITLVGLLLTYLKMRNL